MLPPPLVGSSQMGRIAFVAAAVVLAGTLVHTQPAPVRIDTPVALKQIVTRVEPVWPPGAVNANPGAVMAADVVVTAAGTVESVNVITGPEAFRPALIAALKKWTFKPFLSGGRPSRIVTMVDFEIRNPAKEREDKAIDDFFDAERACRRSVQMRLSDAVVTCERAATLSKDLPPDRALERSGAEGMFGGSLMMAGRPAEALVQFEAAIAHRRARVRAGDADADTADLYSLVAQAHWRIGDLSKADAAFVTAIAIYERAIRAVPSLQANYRQRLDRKST